MPLDKPGLWRTKNLYSNALFKCHNEDSVNLLIDDGLRGILAILLSLFSFHELCEFLQSGLNPLNHRRNSNKPTAAHHRR